jgi:hypothetical protein
MPDLTAGDSLSWTREASELVRLARRVGRSAGLEHSIKIAAAGIDARRFLISIAVRPDFRAALEAGLAALAFPTPLKAPLADSLARMRFLHLGYAEPDGMPVAKLYCEAAPYPGTRVRMHESFKWRPRGGDFVRDDYWLVQGLDAAGLRARLAASLEDGPVRGAARTLLDRALARTDAADLFFLEVVRDGVPRSCDLRLYDAGLTLADAAPVAGMVAEAFGVGTPDIAGREGASLGHSLGHVSAGADFLTLYYGVEDLA